MDRKKITTNFTGTKEWKNEIENWEQDKPFNIYARYDSPELREREKHFAEMVGAEDAAIFNSGMAAIVSAIEAEDLKTGDVILCGKGIYDKADEYISDLRKKGFRIVKIDSGNIEEIENSIKAERPRLIYLESVGNNIEMPVCDINKLTELADEANKFYKEELNYEKLLEKYFKVKGKKDVLEGMSAEDRNGIESALEEYKVLYQPISDKEKKEALKTKEKHVKTKNIRNLVTKFGKDEAKKILEYLASRRREKLSIIIDNTLPSPFLYNPLHDAGDSSTEVVVVESGTKHYQKGQDKITLGIVYSNNKEKVEKTRHAKATVGTYLQPIADREIPADIAQTAPEILKRHGENALKLARLLEQSGSQNILRVSHPNLESHKNNKLANKITPEGIVTLFYIKAQNEASAEKFVQKVKELGEDSIGIGGSFGHEKTWLFFHKDQIRIAAGSESPEDFEKIMDIFKKAAE